MSLRKSITLPLAAALIAAPWPFALTGPALAQDSAGEQAITQLQGIVDQWLASPHADITSDSFHHWDEEGAIPANCATCHSTIAFVDYVRGAMAQAGIAPQAVDTGSVVDCAACHSTPASNLVSVPFPSGVQIDTFEESATCVVCHQGRTSGLTVAAATEAMGDDDVSSELGFINVHYTPAAGTLMGSVTQTGYQYPGKDYDGQFSHVPDFANCTDCHQPHSLEMVAMENCATCHQGAESYDAIRTTGIDLDGDGDTSEGIANPIATLHGRLYEAIQAYGTDVAGTAIIYADRFPYFFTDTNDNGAVDEGEAAFPNRYQSWTPRLLRAAYNYQFIAKDHGAYAHNPHYAVQLLYDSIEDLGTQVTVDMAAMARP